MFWKQAKSSTLAPCPPLRKRPMALPISEAHGCGRQSHSLRRCARKDANTADYNGQGAGERKAPLPKFGSCSMPSAICGCASLPCRPRHTSTMRGRCLRRNSARPGCPLPYARLSSRGARIGGRGVSHGTASATPSASASDRRAVPQDVALLRGPHTPRSAKR